MDWTFYKRIRVDYAQLSDVYDRFFVGYAQIRVDYQRFSQKALNHPSIKAIQLVGWLINAIVVRVLVFHATRLVEVFLHH